MAWTANELIASSGGDFATIVAFESDHDGDTPTNGTLCQGRVKGNTESGTCYWGGWQSGQNATTRIVLTAESGSETDGTDGSGDDAVIDTVQSLGEATNAFYLDITRIEISVGRINISQDGGGQIRMARSYMRNIANHAILMNNLNADTTIKVGACLFKAAGTDSGKSAIFLIDASITTAVDIYNNTIYGSTNGLYEVAGTFNVKNCAIADCTTDYNSVTTMSYCASEDATATGTGSVTGITPADEWTTPATGATGDFTVKDTGADIYHAGVAIADSWFTDLCPTDLAGNSWNSSPSMGCFEFVGGAAGNLAGDTNITLSAQGLSTATGALIGDGLIELLASAELTGSGSISADTLISAFNSGILTASAELTGSTLISINLAGDLTSDQGMYGDTTISLSLEGIIGGAGSLSGSTTIALLTDASISASGALAANNLITLSASGELTSGNFMFGEGSIGLSLEGAIQGAGSLGGIMDISLSPSGQMSAGGALSGDTTISIDLSGTFEQDTSELIPVITSSIVDLIKMNSGISDVFNISVSIR